MTSRDGRPPWSFLLFGFPRNSTVECVVYSREMVGITRVACRSRLLLRGIRIVVVDDARLLGKSKQVVSRSRKKGRKGESKGLVRKSEIKRVTRAPTTDVDPRERKDQSVARSPRLTETKREDGQSSETRGEERRRGVQVWLGWSARRFCREFDFGGRE